jgi:hypothetical protein
MATQNVYINKMKSRSRILLPLLFYQIAPANFLSIHRWPHFDQEDEQA